VSLVAAFLTVAVVAVCFAGHFYQAQHAAAARLRPAVAVLSQPGPVATATPATAEATWPLPNGTHRSGALTTVTAPGIYNAPAGTSLPVWLDRSGEPAVPPLSLDDMILTALVAGFSIAAGAAVVLTLCYHLCRIVLDRRRLARWESAWATIGPQWTSRR
jgi:multisubunit Na+/H+ antiporter MnhC subunit